MIDGIPNDGLPMPQYPIVKEVPLKRLIRLINNIIDDLSSFPKSLMIFSSSAFETDPGPLIYETWRSGKCQRQDTTEMCDCSFFLPSTSPSHPSLCLTDFLQWIEHFLTSPFTVMHIWRHALSSPQSNRAWVTYAQRWGFLTFINSFYRRIFLCFNSKKNSYI